jgi:AraC-like DNA-binding protein
MHLPAWDSGFFARLGDPGALAVLLDSLPDAYFFAKDREGRFVAMNRALLDVLGLARSRDVLGRNDYDVFPHDLADAYRAEDEMVMDSGVPVHHQVWHVPNPQTGEIQWFVSTKVPLFGPGKVVVGVGGMMRPWDPGEGRAAEFRRLAEVLRHVERHHGERLSVEDLALVARLSVRQFQRLFSRVLRVGPIRYLAQVRVRAACTRLARTEDPISEIALDCGFYDQSHFCNQFRKLKGVSPSGYRRRFRPA